MAGAESDVAAGRFDNAANRAYYGAFQAVSTALRAESIRPGEARQLALAHIVRSRLVKPALTVAITMSTTGGVEPWSNDQTLTILVVEDDEPTANLVRTLLNQVPGWGATVVHDAAAAREVFRHVRIEVLVLDVNLPGISGIELLSLLRQDPHWQEPPVILMSAHPEQPAVQAAMIKGDAIRFIAKPFDVDELIAAVRLAWAERQHAGPARCT